MAPLGPSPPPTYGTPTLGQSIGGMGNAMTDLADSLARRQSLQDVYIGCMAERGWVVTG